jgi:hypothetical protein
MYVCTSPLYEDGAPDWSAYNENAVPPTAKQTLSPLMEFLLLLEHET